MMFKQLKLNGIQTTLAGEVKSFLDGIQERARIGEPAAEARAE